MSELILHIKAFIYRFSAIFGLRIYLAQKEEDHYIVTLGGVDKLTESISRGTWQAKYGFCTVWTYKMNPLQAFKARVKNAFTLMYWRRR